MAYTEKLYFTDSSLLDFTADIIEVDQAGDSYRVVLDRTAFYPTGGGQPNDTGKLDQLDVTDVFEDDSGTVFHVVACAGTLTVGQNVRGVVDTQRRLDHLQQHSGQHVLSQAFVQACGAETRSFHLGSIVSTIDIELASPSDEQMRAAEDVANRVILEDRPMRVHILDEADAAKLPLRKESAVKGRIRVIEVEDFDWSPCGGTHAARTGQIGLIAIKSYERAKKLTRVEFVCGFRALADYRLAHRTATSVARMFSVDRDSAADSVARALAENRLLKRRVRELSEVAAGAEAAELLAAAENLDTFKMVCRVFEGRDADELRMLAYRIVQTESSVALLGSDDGGTARVVFARSETVPHNMGEVLREACTILGGRGGGKAEIAQGGGPEISKLAAALEDAASRVRGR
jgi:alanyl-tRNA synthetase